MVLDSVLENHTMSTIWKHPQSKYWFAKITLPDGRRTSRTTKQIVRKDALEAARTMEIAAALARKNELTQSAVVKLASDLCASIGAPAIASKNIRDFFNDALATREGRDGMTSTLRRYRPIVTGFLASLGASRSAASLASLTTREIEDFRDAEVVSGKSKTTADFAVKVLRGIIKPAVQRGQIIHNPAAAVGSAGGEAQEREPFTADELAALLKAARGGDWEGMILLGAHCGIRLADAAHLTWGAYDSSAKTLEFTPTKTGRKVRLALHEEVVGWIESRPRGIAKAPLFPSLFNNKTGSAGGLSNAFNALMAKAKIAVPRGEERTGRGRTFRSKGFHGLRHTMISRMANADVQADVRRAVAGHASDAAHKRYVHLKVETQARAQATMPALGG